MLKPERRVVRVNRVLPKLRNTCVSVLSVCRTTLQETRGNGHEGYHATGAARGCATSAATAQSRQRRRPRDFLREADIAPSASLDDV